MGLFSQAKPSKPKFFEGQKGIGNDIFGPGGPIRALFEGGPDPGFQAGVNRAFGNLNQSLATQGIFGQPIGARAAVDLGAKSAVGEEQNRLQTLLSSIQPYGVAGASPQGAGKTFLQGAIGL